MAAKSAPDPGLCILFASSEAYPLVKVGGLGDVSGALPAALRARDADCRLILPAFHQAKANAGPLKPVARLQLPLGEVTLLETCLPDSGVPVWLVDHPPLFDHPGSPYEGPASGWADNSRRFALFAQAVVAVALDHAGLGWWADILHGNDWQTGLCFPLLQSQPQRPGTVFTIHNLAYQGLFPHAAFDHLGLGHELRHYQALEFHHQLNFMKGGLVFADRLTTVSPNYAGEIQHAWQGYGLDGVLRQRSASLQGIVNGIDTGVWNPSSDPFLARNYTTRSLHRKAENKAALQAELGLHQDPVRPLFGLVGRLVEQKGIDLVLATAKHLANRGGQLAVLGAGDAGHEWALHELSRHHPGAIAVRIAQDEGLAHRIEGSADFFLMPSRFEPCGLNQMYSQRYGTPPIVHRTGGLADTVEHGVTGIVFEHADPNGLHWAMEEALGLYQRPADYLRMQKAGMARDFSWKRAAASYLSLYKELARDHSKPLD